MLETYYPLIIFLLIFCINLNAMQFQKRIEKLELHCFDNSLTHQKMTNPDYKTQSDYQKSIEQPSLSNNVDLETKRNTPLGSKKWLTPKIMLFCILAITALTNYNVFDNIITRATQKTNAKPCFPQYITLGDNFFFKYELRGSCDAIDAVKQLKDRLYFAVSHIPTEYRRNNAACLKLSYGNYWGYLVTEGAGDSDESAAACDDGAEMI